MAAIRHRWRLMATAMAAACVVGACSDEDAAPPPPSTTTGPAVTATPEVTPSPVAPTLPAGATADPKGAEVFVRYFWDVFNYTYATGDTRLLRSISDKSCGFCSDVAGDVDQLRNDGGRTEGGEVKLSKVLAAPEDPKNGLIVVTVISQEQSRTIDRQGTLVSEGQAITNRLTNILTLYKSGKWQVAGVEVTDGPES